MRLLERTCQLGIDATIDVRDHVSPRAEAHAIARDGAWIRNTYRERRFFSWAKCPVIERHVFRRHQRARAIEQRDNGREPFHFDAARWITHGALDRQDAD